MKRWKVYVLCAMCVLGIGLLTGCGNREKNSTGTLNNERTEESRATDRVNEGVNDATGNNLSDRNDMTDNGSMDRNDITDDNLTGNDNLNREDMTEENNSDIGNAVEDLADGVGNAGKDIVNGIEDAGDSLVGNDTTEQSEKR